MSIFGSEHIGEDRCFLCGSELNDDNRSVEHVMPMWLQHEFCLADQHIVLLNETSIPYRQLVIPCCISCNTVHLANLENDVGAAFKLGFESVKSLPRLRLYQWCNKIYYGLLYRELSLLADRAKPGDGMILDRKGLEALHTHHIFLQSVRVPYIFDGFQPASIFVVPTHTYPDKRLNFDYLDALLLGTENPSLGLFFAIRCGSAGVICAFDDLGLLEERFRAQFSRFGEKPLHPLQFIEMAANVAYQHSLRLTPTKYTSSSGPAGVISKYTGPSHYEWRTGIADEYMDVFRRYLARGTGKLPPGAAECPSDQVWTTLQNPDGSTKVLNPDGTEAEPV